MKKRTGTKFIRSLGKGNIVSTCIYKDSIFIATTEAIYFVRNNILKKLITSDELGELKIGQVITR